MTDHRCTERALREAAGDADFWDHVLGVEEACYPDTQPDLDDDGQVQDEACPECGEHGPCGYDALGRPMIHIASEEDYT